MFDLARLRILRELAHRGTVSAAAEACGMTSSAASQHLATLEREARAVLLERDGRRVRLTPEGVRLAGHAEIILDRVEAAALDMAAGKDRPIGKLTVAAFATFAKVRLLPALARLRAAHPGLEIVLHELEPVDSHAAVREGRCDVAIGFAYNLAPRADPPGLVTWPLCEEPVRLVLPPAWRNAPEPFDVGRLAGADWIVGARQDDDLRLIEPVCAAAGFAPRLTHGVADYGLVLAMIAAGLGVGFVPDMALKAHPAADVVVRTVSGVAPTRRIHAVTRRALAGSARVKALMEALAAK